MNLDRLRRHVQIELESLSATVCEIESLLHDAEGREATVRERTAAGGFLVRHVVRNAYGHELTWDRLVPAMRAAGPFLKELSTSVIAAMDGLGR